MVKGFSKMYNFLDKFFFCKHFYYITGFCDKKFNFCKLANFFEDSKSRGQELSNDVSFVIFGHQTWDLEGVFKYPSRDRVNIIPIWLFLCNTILLTWGVWYTYQSNLSRPAHLEKIYLKAERLGCKEEF